jgi:hypothetical protein
VAEIAGRLGAFSLAETLLFYGPEQLKKTILNQ